MHHHLVVLHEEYLRLILSGRKRMECRLSSIRRAPFECVSPGDFLWFKIPSGPVSAMAQAGECLFRRLQAGHELGQLLREYGPEICARDGFFKDAAIWARYASLVRLKWIAEVTPFHVAKSDQRAWVVLNGPLLPGMKIDRERATART